MSPGGQFVVSPDSARGERGRDDRRCPYDEHALTSIDGAIAWALLTEGGGQWRQRQWLHASGERIKLIEFDRDAAIKALDDQELSEQQHTDPRCAGRAAGTRRKWRLSLCSPNPASFQ